MGERLADLRVLVVQANGADRDGLACKLCQQGCDVSCVDTGLEALEAHNAADFVLLDLELPDLDGLEICRSIRLASDVPLIAVTARGSELDRVLGLQAGADDYVVKPYGFRELTARMDAVLRRLRPHAPVANVISRGELRIDPAFREVSLAGVRIGMTRKEFDLLYLLASNPHTVISRERLMRQIWGGSWSRRTVDTHVSSLRNKLGNSDWIITVRGVGFRFGHGMPPPRSSFTATA